jgi:predicted enzyme related to lactoylglutathione lyase
MAPSLANGKICYLEIPALDIPLSVAFYQAVFGWHTRQRGDRSTAFDDGVGEVSGTWVMGRTPSQDTGLLVYIMVDDVAATIEAVIAHGGRLVHGIGGDAPEVTARFLDPAGNIFGLYQEPSASVPATTE